MRNIFLVFLFFFVSSCNSSENEEFTILYSKVKTFDSTTKETVNLADRLVSVTFFYEGSNWILMDIEGAIVRFYQVGKVENTSLNNGNYYMKFRYEGSDGIGGTMQIWSDGELWWNIDNNPSEIVIMGS